MHALVYNYNNTAIRICVDKHDNGQISGRICNPLLINPLPFTDVGNMLIKIDNFLDSVGYPCAFQKLRTFFPEKERESVEYNKTVDAQKAIPTEDIKGALLTFEIRITSRQNASWQGIMDYAGEKIQFKSALQFLRLADDLVQNTVAAA